jgi:hypothetical protein
LDEHRNIARRPATASGTEAGETVVVFEELAEGAKLDGLRHSPSMISQQGQAVSLDF